jgi:hypothetical protein
MLPVERRRQSLLPALICPTAAGMCWYCDCCCCSAAVGCCALRCSDLLNDKLRLSGERNHVLRALGAGACGTAVADCCRACLAAEAGTFLSAGGGAYHILRDTDASVKARTLGVVAADTLTEASLCTARCAACAGTVFAAPTAAELVGAARELLLLAIAVEEVGNEDTVCCSSSTGGGRGSIYST